MASRRLSNSMEKITLKCAWTTNEARRQLRSFKFLLIPLIFLCLSSSTFAAPVTAPIPQSTASQPTSATLEVKSKAENLIQMFIDDILSGSMKRLKESVTSAHQELQAGLEMLLPQLVFMTVQTPVNASSPAEPKVSTTPPAMVTEPPCPKMSRTEAQEELWEGVKWDDGVRVVEAARCGADPEAEDLHGQLTPMTLAVREGSLRALEALIKLGADLGGTYDGWTPLHWAAWTGRKDIAKVLLQAGANIRARDPAGYTPADVAYLMEHTNLHSYLRSFL